MATRSMILLGAIGDAEIVWDEEHDAAMREVIQKKMDEGVRFFIMKPIFGGLLERRSRISSPEQAQGSVRIRDRDIESLLSSGKARVLRKVSGSRFETTKMAKSAEEVVASSTIATRPLVGG